MQTIHDAQYRATLQSRIRALGPASTRRWGKMSVDQMLWHVNQVLETALGRNVVQPRKLPLPVPIMKFLVLNLPWPKGVPALPEFVAKQAFDLEAERSRCLRLIDELSSRDIAGEWPRNPAFGSVTGTEVSRLQAKHVNHHLKQFGV
jgi:hypothetical protein